MVIRKQKTTESAPTSHLLLSNTGTLKQFPRQHSTASAYSMAIPSTYSNQGITLVRGASCSLVDIPTYLGPANVGIAGKSGASVGNVPIAALAPRPPRPRLQLDLTKKNAAKNSTRKTRKTILCVGLTLLTMCVTLVGTMLSIGSQYEGTKVARRWEDQVFTNKSSNIFSKTAKSDVLLTTKSTTLSPLMSILKISKEDVDNFGSRDGNLIKDHQTSSKKKSKKAPPDGVVGYRGKKLSSFLSSRSLFIEKLRI